MREHGIGNPEQEETPEAAAERQERVRAENERVSAQVVDIYDLKPDNRYAHLYDTEEVRILNRGGNPLEIRQSTKHVDLLAPFSRPQDLVKLDYKNSYYEYDEKGRLTNEKLFTIAGEIGTLLGADVGKEKDKLGRILRSEGRAEHDPETGAVTIKYFNGDGAPTNRREVRSKDGSVRMFYKGEKLVGKIFEERDEKGAVKRRTTFGGDGKVVTAEEMTYGLNDGETTTVRKGASGKVKGKTVESLRSSRDLVAERAERKAAERSASASEGDEDDDDESNGGISDFEREQRDGLFGSGLGF